jgi:hypothetical protein
MVIMTMEQVQKYVEILKGIDEMRRRLRRVEWILGKVGGACKFGAFKVSLEHILKLFCLGCALPAAAQKLNRVRAGFKGGRLQPLKAPG